MFFEIENTLIICGISWHYLSKQLNKSRIQKYIDQLFRIDYCHSKEGTNKESGTGLGLLLCREFIEMHKGEIWIESEIGKGSTFKFSIPHC
ncbi:ATP-binding protein [Labilibaculum antarcticum]|uniref:ATP-binding protein n=1 Tax=Labilibaculum antarcticum TaxID=1717717 RepID=UPI001E2A95FD|nr:ATP-binding protein [Labilibaculum antarcticum]